jgi:hypothetical protein
MPGVKAGAWGTAAGAGVAACADPAVGVVAAGRCWGSTGAGAGVSAAGAAGSAVPLTSAVRSAVVLIPSA